MAFEKLRTIVITAIPKPRSRRKVPQDCRNHPNSPKTRFEDAMLIPQKNEISRAGPLLERFRKIAETTPSPRRRALRTRCLSLRRMRSAEQVRCSKGSARLPKPPQVPEDAL